MPADSLATLGADRNFIGFIDSVEHGTVRGWAAEAGIYDHVAVELLIDGLPFGTTPANLYRDDLLQAELGTGNHGFRMPIPPDFFDAQPHDVAVRIAGSDHLLRQPGPDVVLGHPPAPPGLAAELPAPRLHRAVELSIIMPTYNRGAMMQTTVERYARSVDRMGAELIVIDDGSRDDTPDRLRSMSGRMSRLVTERLDNGGPAHARNIAAAMARGRILVFVGDDVRPVDDDFLPIHAAAHAKMPSVGHAVLGKITWPNADAMPVNFVMSHIQGDGEQQFGYRNMTAYQWYDWRLFYSSNVSVKKALVPDWLTGGYDRSFHLAAFEDPEFALRTSLRLQEAEMPFGVFYVPAAQLEHHHPYTTAGFIARQVAVGMMAQRFLELHPGRAADLGLDGLVAQLALPLQDTPFPVEHYFAVFEGFKSWALVIEHHYGLGQKNWHGDLLRAVFQLAFFEGFLRVQTGPAVNLAAGCRHVMEAVRAKMNRAIASEMLGEIPGFALV